MADSSPIYGPPKQKLYESKEDDPAAIADAKMKADYEAKKADICKQDPDRIPCAPPAKKDQTSMGVSYADLAKTMSQPKPDPTPAPNARRDAWQSEADVLAKRLLENPLPYVGKKEDQARLADLQSKLASTPKERGLGIPATSDSSRQSKDGVLKGSAGVDGSSVYADGSYFQKTYGTTQVRGPHGSVQIGATGTDVGISGGRITDSDGSGTVTAEGPSARATAGVGRNDDGSVGGHVGLSAGIASVQVTRKLRDGGEVTLGVSEGVGASGSVGVKTTDQGETAVCVQVSALVFTVGGCLPVSRF